MFPFDSMCKARRSSAFPWLEPCHLFCFCAHSSPKRNFVSSCSTLRRTARDTPGSRLKFASALRRLFLSETSIKENKWRANDTAFAVLHILHASGKGFPGLGSKRAKAFQEIPRHLDSIWIHLHCRKFQFEFPLNLGRIASF